MKKPNDCAIITTGSTYDHLDHSNQRQVKKNNDQDHSCAKYSPDHANHYDHVAKPITRNYTQLEKNCGDEGGYFQISLESSGHNTAKTDDITMNDGYYTLEPESDVGREVLQLPVNGSDPSHHTTNGGNSDLGSTNEMYHDYQILEPEQ